MFRMSNVEGQFPHMNGSSYQMKKAQTLSSVWAFSMFVTAIPVGVKIPVITIQLLMPSNCFE